MLPTDPIDLAGNPVEPPLPVRVAIGATAALRPSVWFRLAFRTLWLVAVTLAWLALAVYGHRESPDVASNRSVFLLLLYQALIATWIPLV
jgi:hypothetical protein